MPDHKSRFLALAEAAGALSFGSFTLKSGRVSPYFFNAGLFNRGKQLAELGRCYAEALLHSGLHVDMLFGPAYKGIPLATTTAVALAERGHDLPVAFNRKEAKDHGEGGLMIGAPLVGDVLIVDDVITAGTAVRESLIQIRAAGARPCGVLIALDRQERGTGVQSAAQELTECEGIPVLAIAGLDDVLSYTERNPALEQHRLALLDYRARYSAGGQ